MRDAPRLTRHQSRLTKHITQGTANLLPRLQRLAAFHPLFVTVTWGAGGSTATKSLDLAEICAAHFHLDVCLHLTCTNSSKAVIDEALLRCHELGIRNILALRGDEPRPSEYGDPATQTLNGSSRRHGGQPDEGASNGFASGHDADDDEAVEFIWAEDLVRYIRRKYGDWFCIGVAGYPEGWTASPYDPDRSLERDLPHLVRKVEAGADFIMTQLFYDVDAFLKYEHTLRNHESGALADIAIVPGLMPVQSWGILMRTTKLTCARVPQDILAQFAKVKTDDDGVKAVGVEVLQGMVKTMRESLLAHDQLDPPQHQRKRRRPPQGFHFYTLNLEKAVAQILNRCGLIPRNAENAADADVVEDGPPLQTPSDDRSNGDYQKRAAERRRTSSTHNRVIVTRPSESEGESPYQEGEREAAQPKESNRAHARAIAEGEGSLGREATWDDYPNGRFGDARSPAFGSIDGYGPSLHVTHSEAIMLWGRPTEKQHISDIFHRYLQGQLSQVPWSEDSLSEETRLIQEHLVAMNKRGWWSVASQPAVDCARSNDPVVGWGPQVGGWVWQKPFVEFFLSKADWEALKERMDRFNEQQEEQDKVAYYAGDAHGTFVSSAPDSVNPVTWGSFSGKE